MNKKVLTGVIIAVAILVIGGVTYYFYNLASADAYTQTFCAGLTGGNWRNCSQDMTDWKKYLQTHTNAQFNKQLKRLDSLS